MTGEVFADLEANKYQFAEYRLSIYGRNQAEWGRLGKTNFLLLYFGFWFVNIYLFLRLYNGQILSLYNI